MVRRRHPGTDRRVQRLKLVLLELDHDPLAAIAPNAEADIPRGERWQRLRSGVVVPPSLAGLTSRIAAPARERSAPASFCGVLGGDASSSAGGELLRDDLERRRDRHADDRTDQSEERPERQDTGKDGEAGDLGGLTDDRRLQDVVLNLLVDHHHDHKDDQGLEADRQRDESDDEAGDRRADAGDEVEDPR